MLQRARRARAQAAAQPVAAPRVAAKGPSDRRSASHPWRIAPQLRLAVSQAHDPAEREADAVAQAVMHSPAPAVTVAPAAVQRKPAAAAPQADPELESEIRAAQGGGMPLPPSLRRFMEPRLRADLSAVRIHADGRAASLAARVAARAFALGRDIFFGRGEYRPDSEDGRALIAHELTHTIQQRAVIQRQAAVPAVRQHGPPAIQRLGLDTVLDYIADKANLIPGFRMFTIVLGVNPVNMSRVEATPANILRAVIEFIPGASLVTQALDNHGVFDKVAHWAAQQIKALGMAGSAIKKALTDFLDSLGLGDLARPGATYERAKRIFTAPIDRIKGLVKGFVAGIVGFVKEAILRPIARLAEGTPSYDLLKGVLGKDPITGQTADASADLLIGGFMKLVGQREVYDNAKKSGAVPRAFAWFKGALADLKGFVLQIPPTFIAAFKSLQLADIVLVPRAFAKLAGVFGSFLGRFVAWAGQAVWNLLEIIFSVVKPGALDYVKKTGAALKSILKNPLPFVGNLAKAAKAGFQGFASRFGSHLQKGLIEWLTGSLTGVYIPRALSLPEIVKFALSVLGLTWANLRAKMVKAFGEPAVQALEKGFAIVKTLVTQGPAAAWEQMKADLMAQKDVVIDGIRNMVIEAVVTKAIPKLIAMFIPGAGFISAIVSIYDIVMVFVQKIARIVQVVRAFVDSIVAIAAGAVGAAAAKVESVLAGLLALAINFLAGFAGLGKIANKINGIIQKIRAPVDKALDKLVAWIKRAAAKLLGALRSGAEALLQWWKKKSAFSDKKGRAHRLFISGQGASARLKVASAEMFTEEFVAKVQAAFAEDALAKSFGLPYLNRCLKLKTEWDALKSKVEAENKAKSPSAKFTDKKIQQTMDVLAGNMGPLFDILPENRVDDLPAKPGDKITLPYRAAERMAEVLFVSVQRVQYEIKSASGLKTHLATPDFRAQWKAGTIRPYVEGGAREQYLGATPGKASATGRSVIARYRTKTEGSVVLVEWRPGRWHPLDDCDMSHDPVDAVTYWNRVRGTTSPKSETVRRWMLDPRNYILEPLAINRARGARAGDRYLPP